MRRRHPAGEDTEAKGTIKIIDTGKLYVVPGLVVVGCATDMKLGDRYYNNHHAAFVDDIFERE